MSRSRAERSLLSVLERERDRTAASSSSASPPVSSSPPPQVPSSWPPLHSPVAWRAQSRAPSRGPSRSASPILLRDALGFGYTPNANGERELDLASLVERSIALQSSPTNTPPSSPPRGTRRPYFSTSPSMSAAATIAETTESDTDTTGAHRKRAATLNDTRPTERGFGPPVARRPSMGSRTRSSPAQAHCHNGSPVAAPVPRRAAAMAAASSLLPNAHTGVTHLPAARDPSQAYTPSNTLAVRASRAVPSRSQSPPAHPSRPLSPFSYPGAGHASQVSQASSSTQHNLRPAISIASVASAASAQSNTSMVSASESRVLTPAATPPQGSPLNPRPKQRIERSPRAISGPFLAPSMAPAEADLPFDIERAARRLRNVPGRVCFDDVALFPPSDDADDEEEAEDQARKRPRMGRRWSLW